MSSDLCLLKDYAKHKPRRAHLLMYEKKSSRLHSIHFKNIYNSKIGKTVNLTSYLMSMP